MRNVVKVRPIWSLSLTISFWARVIVHEIGHSLSLLHDDNIREFKGVSCNCRSHDCVMHSKSSHRENGEWSSCTRAFLLRKEETFPMDLCTRNRPAFQQIKRVQIEEQNCGNFILENGEECDCGPEDTCTNDCCNAEDCTLFLDATCANGACCDMKTCKVNHHM